MSKNYKIKVSKKLVNKLIPYWKQIQKMENAFHVKLFKLEKRMSKDTGIDDLEIFRCDGEICGIGNVARSMRLIHNRELEKVK